MNDLYFHPGQGCRCHDCVVEYVKDWENGDPIYFPDTSCKHGVSTTKRCNACIEEYKSYIRKTLK